MRPLSLEFKETPTKKDIDYSMIEYDPILNLSIDRNTSQPAIAALSLDTETFTKANGEVSDSDDNGGLMFMDTMTRTLMQLESSDNDYDRRNLLALLDTTTITESRENTDQDR